MACDRRGGPSAQHHRHKSHNGCTGFDKSTGGAEAEVFSPHSHPLFFSPAEDVHPVLDRVPAALPVQDVTQLDLVQIFPQHLHRDVAKHETLSWRKLKSQRSAVEKKDSEEEKGSCLIRDSFPHLLIVSVGINDLIPERTQGQVRSLSKDKTNKLI